MRLARVGKYLIGYTVPLSVWVSLTVQGPWVFTSLIYAFMCIPLLEWMISPDARNFSALEEEVVKKDPLYDWLLYLHVPLQYVTLWWYLHQTAQPGLLWWEKAGMLTAMGINCGVIGINVAHELGHRLKKYEQVMAVLLLSSSLYAHFFIEHNKGHHKRVSTPDDPSTARLNEPIYRFYVRTITGTLISAWEIQRQELRAAGKGFVSIHNTLLMLFLGEAVLITVIGLLFGWAGIAFFLGAAVMGFLLLESVQYIEHYGLVRTRRDTGLYERVMPWHSWNSDHVLGRVVLYELTRHSDHHYLASRKYQILRHQDEAPQLPAGYPGMIIMALIPPLFFKIMNPRVQSIMMAHAQV